MVKKSKEKEEGEREFCPSLGSHIKRLVLLHRALVLTGDHQDGDASDGPGETQADQHQRDCRRGKCGGVEERF